MCQKIVITVACSLHSASALHLPRFTKSLNAYLYSNRLQGYQVQHRRRHEKGLGFRRSRTANTKQASHSPCNRTRVVCWTRIRRTAGDREILELPLTWEATSLLIHLPGVTYHILRRIYTVMPNSMVHFLGPDSHHMIGVIRPLRWNARGSGSRSCVW